MGEFLAFLVFFVFGGFLGYKLAKKKFEPKVVGGGGGGGSPSVPRPDVK